MPKTALRSLLILLLLGSVIAGCSSDDDADSEIPDSDDLVSTTTQPDATTTTTAPQLTLEEATLQFTDCMRDEGVPISDIRIDDQGRPVLSEALDGIDTGTDEFQVALATCASVLTNSGALDLGADPELQAVILDQLQDFTDCMRDEGIDGFPDPDPSFDGSGSPYPLEQIPLTDPAFQQALVECQDVLGSLSLGG